MTPAQILTLVRDGLILAALAFMAWKIYLAGEERVKSQDLKVIQTQLESNLKTQAQWAEDARNAEVQHRQDLSTVSAAIASHRDPIVILRDAPGARPVSGATTAPADSSADSRRTDAGSGGNPVDIRASISAFELKYETSLADCRAAVASWPK